MDEARYRLAAGGFMLVAAAVVVASLWVDRLGALGAEVPTLLLAVAVYLLGVVAIAPVHLRAGEHRRLVANLLIGLGVACFAWSTVDGPPVAAAAGLVVLLGAGVLLYLDGESEEDEGATTDGDAEGAPATDP